MTIFSQFWHVEPILTLLRPPRGSVKLIFTKVINCVSLEQLHHKPMEIYDGGPLVIELLQWNMVSWLGEDELHKHPMMALRY